MPKNDKIILQKGNVYLLKDTQQECEMLEFLADSDELYVRNLSTLKTEIVKLTDLQNVPTNDEYIKTDLSEISDEQLKKAQEKYDAIKPLLESKSVSVRERAKEINVPFRSLYRWLNAYQTTNSLIGLIDRKSGWVEGNSRLDKKQEEVIQRIIENFYLTKVRPTIEQTCREVYRICYKEGVEQPSRNAIKLRIKKIDEKEALQRRGKRELAKNRFTPTPNQFPNANSPLSVVQIDHTPVDLILVDSQHRKPIGRPYLTLAIDVYSRVITGYYLSLDEPSATSVAMCVARSILPKDDLLHQFGLDDADWAVFGYPHKIHVDNGSDFQSKTFAKACQINNIQLEFRPVARPQYGGHIERLIGTFMKEVHNIHGTTFSNIQKREGYNSEKEAALTLDEFEKWLLTFIVKVYNKRKHSALGTSPMAQWKLGIFGNDHQEGIGIPAYPQDSKTLLLDFMPIFERTVQHFGVTIDGLRYYDTCLNAFINKTGNNGKKETYIFKRDPRDISQVWFYDPIIKEYFKVCLANRNIPAISLWELQQARKSIKQKGDKYLNDHQVYEAITEMREIVESSTQSTKKARRQQQRQKSHEKLIKQVNKTMIDKTIGVQEEISNQLIDIKPSEPIKSAKPKAATNETKSSQKPVVVESGLLTDIFKFDMGEID